MSYCYTAIRKNIWQIAEDDGVCCTLIRGSRQALLIDTGYGRRDLRTFIESRLSTPYQVICSHCHPDHTGGNFRFDAVSLPERDLPLLPLYGTGQSPAPHSVSAGTRLDLGALHVTLVPLYGHTQGSLGFLVEEERLLVTGDAFNEWLWLFTPGSLSLRELRQTPLETVKLPFDSYLCGHSQEEYPRDKLWTHVCNIDQLQIDETTRQTLLGFETYTSSYADHRGHSAIVFSPDKL